MSTIKTIINANIRQNGNRAITGNVLNGVLNAMVDDTDEKVAQKADAADLAPIRESINDLDTKTRGITVDSEATLMTETLDMQGNPLINLPTPTDEGDAVNLSYLEGYTYAKAETYTKEEVDEKISHGVGVDAYTKAETDAKLAEKADNNGVVHIYNDEVVYNKKTWNGVQEYSRKNRYVVNGGLQFNNSNKFDKIEVADGRTLQDDLDAFSESIEGIRDELKSTVDVVEFNNAIGYIHDSYATKTELWEKADKDTVDALTNVVEEKANSTDLANIYEDLNTKAVKPPFADSLSEDGAYPNIYYSLGTISESLRIDLVTISLERCEEYLIEFSVGETVPTVTWPEGVKFANGAAPTLNANKTYVVSIMNNLAVVGEF